MDNSGGSRIFLTGAPTPKLGVLTYFVAKNCMKMKEFGLLGARIPGTPPLDPPLECTAISTIYEFSVI